MSAMKTHKNSNEEAVQHQVQDQHHQQLIVLVFNCTSTLVGHFVLSPMKKGRRDRNDSRGDEREGQGRKTKMNESEENIPPLPLPVARIAGLA